MENPASNTEDCWREFIGQRLKGLVINPESRTLVFEDGRGLTVHHAGSYWITPVLDVTRAIEERRQHLRRIERDLQDVLLLAGEPPTAVDAVREDAGLPIVTIRDKTASSYSETVRWPREDADVVSPSVKTDRSGLVQEEHKEGGARRHDG